MMPQRERSEFSRQIVTEEERQQLHAARRIGGLCAACGRDLAEDEPVWQEWFKAEAPWRFMNLAPVGRECVSAAFLVKTESVEPERCVWCRRGVYYPPASAKPGRRRTRAMCSQRCGNRASVAQHRQRKEGEAAP